MTLATSSPMIRVPVELELALLALNSGFLLHPSEQSSVPVFK